jgi:hypothetical protein
MSDFMKIRPVGAELFRADGQADRKTCDYSLKFNEMKNTEKSKIHNRGVRKMRDRAMLLLLRRPLEDVATFCAFEKIREPTSA